jgi:hypothetical protein
MRYGSNAGVGMSTSQAIRYLFDTASDPPETTFCGSKEGSSFNAGDTSPPSRFGPAMAGRDKPNIRIADPP